MSCTARLRPSRFVVGHLPPGVFCGNRLLLLRCSPSRLLLPWYMISLGFGRFNINAFISCRCAPRHPAACSKSRSLAPIKCQLTSLRLVLPKRFKYVISLGVDTVDLQRVQTGESTGPSGCTSPTVGAMVGLSDEFLTLGLRTLHFWGLVLTKSALRLTWSRFLPPPRYFYYPRHERTSSEACHAVVSSISHRFLS